MKQKHITFIAGLALGAAIFGGATVFAAGIIAAASTQRFIANGHEVRLEAYLINDRNYVQLRDLSEITGFDLSYDGANNTVYINSGNGQAKPQPTQASGRTVPAGIVEKDLAIWLDENYQPYENEYEAIRLINEERGKAGLNHLTLNLNLCRIARIKATEMAELNYLSHTSPNYGSPRTMIITFGLNPGTTSENVSYLGGEYAEGVVWNWMHSEGHKANILAAKYTQG